MPDGTSRSYPCGVTGMEIATSISKSLAKQALVIDIDGDLCDLDLPITKSSRISIIKKTDSVAVSVIRHDCAHVMAEAVQELFPGTKVTIGPAIDNGFYYDFERAEPFREEDLASIEAKMAEIIKADRPFRRETVSRKDAYERFKKIGENYKLELLEAIPEAEPVTIYHQGSWYDLCRGPHGPGTGSIGAFKLTKVAGSYWRGDSTKAQLQRIYGIAFTSKKELDAYLKLIEEAERRDHRKLGREMALFHIQEEATGCVFWHPKGWTLWQEVENYIRRRLDNAGYQEVKTPQVVDRVLWEKSGHWDKFAEHMFIIEPEENKALALKPMNCPCHVQIFNQKLHSYRDLPMRMAEFGSCHRNEPSGALHGIMRVRAFTQDDAHIFCTPEQIESESRLFFDLLKSVYHDFGFDDVHIKFSDRPENRAGTDEVWDNAEQALMGAIKSAGIDFTMNPGEGAFYGPKLEFVLKDAIGRDWQLGTLQLDFILPERLDASYIGADGAKHRPVMLHRAILGSLERFIGILIENYAGRLPLWLSPHQIAIATITNDADVYAKKVEEKVKKAGLRCICDRRADKISYKIREHSLAKVPVIFSVGQREMEQNTVSVRWLGSKEQQVLDLDRAIKICKRDALPPDLTDLDETLSDDG